MTLKEWRLAKGWTQGQLARAIESQLLRQGKPAISDAHIRSWERGAEPGWSVGEAIRRVTEGEVKPVHLA